MLKPIKFDGANQVFGGHEVEPLSVLNDGVQLLSCWHMTWKERLCALIYGKIWLCVRGQAHPAVWLSASEKEVYENE